MPPRVSLKEAQAEVAARGSIYTPEPRPDEFIPTGCTLLDTALGGGWGRGRVCNIIGDKSSGKTALAIEAAANFSELNPKGRVFYREPEWALDEEHAVKVMGQSNYNRLERCDPNEFQTVEDMMEDVDTILTKCNFPVLYILDSLDALSSRAEMARKIGEGSYGTERAKAMSEFYRTRMGKLAQNRVAQMIVSQVRDRIGVTFGRKWTRSGGRALDFYASQIVVLAHVGYITKTRNKIKRSIGIDVKAKLEKNKVGKPNREVDFPIIWDYGIDDEAASLEWLDQVGATVPKGISPEELKALVVNEWYRIEDDFAPKRRKYQ